MAKPDLGSKRQCLSCGTKFFDMNRDPILCPKCGATFQLTAPRARPVKDEDEDNEIEQSADTVSLEEADAEASAEAATGDDIEIEDDEAADDTFLEEEEEDSDDVSDLIDGDLEDDEES